jgi:hypothetical protein
MDWSFLGAFGSVAVAPLVPKALPAKGWLIMPSPPSSGRSRGVLRDVPHEHRDKYALDWQACTARPAGSQAVFVVPLTGCFANANRRAASR